MLVSHKIGGLPVISTIFDHGWFNAWIIMLAADFGIICIWMMLEGIPPWRRGQYKTFLWNDTVFIPAYLALATWCVGNAAPQYGFYTQTWWHLLLLVLGFTVSIAIEYGAVKAGQYTMSQELSPSKLWHTLIFGVVFYWMLSILAPLLVVLYQGGTGIEMAIFAFCVCGFVLMMYLDATLPFPKDAHLEGTWMPWTWYRRIY